MDANGRIAEAPWALHDPGGRSTFALADGVAGSATFSGCGRYRRTLTRTLDASNPLVAVFIGANPSTARADADDPTVSRETAIARRIGCGALIKVNVMDYRATEPSDLLAPGVVACSGENLAAVMAAVSLAHVVVACHGAVHRRLRRHADAVTGADGALARAGVAMLCLGVTKDGLPRHPLYLRSDTPLRPFEPRA